MDDVGDEYDAYDLSEFSAADFVYIDCTTRQHEYDATPQGAGTRVVTSESGGPQIAVALDPAADESVIVKAAMGRSGSVEIIQVDATRARPRYRADTRSPFEKYRSRGTLSVSDLVGPAWCEVQFDYGLRQGRSRALADRPEAFVSAEGKVITVEKKVAQTNERVLGRGRSVHEKLEREINPEPVAVDISTKEEYWAARLINMLSCLGNLTDLGFCREMPVFGFVQDQAIIGIIDEVLLKPASEPGAEPNSINKRTRASTPGTPQKSKRPRKSSPSQPELTDTVPSSPKGKVRKSASPSHRLMVNELSLLDTKTRRSNSLPSDDDAYSSRMQLMLYHHLLSALLAPTFSFNAFWEKIQVDPFAQLSDAFLLQSGLARESDGIVVLGYPSCLDDLADLWRVVVRSMHVRGLSRTLEIVYRTQPKRGTRNDFATADREARDIARAIASSIRDDNHDPDLERAIAESLRDIAPATDIPAAPADDGKNAQPSSPRAMERPSDKTRVPWYAPEGVTGETESKAMGSAWPMEVSSALGEPSSSFERDPPPPPDASRIIGRKSFAFDEGAMNAHVQNVMQWWRGERAPQGVDIEHVRRCSSCEYREGCEWRDTKAKEARDKNYQVWAATQKTLNDLWGLKNTS
ncbi:exonuclease V a 5' deoxyribonuclease-domain-containing protein [Lactarius hengduanensis]|nr:exonuclease V a 5' deoxyribonuclease-domain-containing protein [Lactarius hengduanensis]